MPPSRRDASCDDGTDSTSVAQSVGGDVDSVVALVPSRAQVWRAKVRRFVRREHEPVSLRHMLRKAMITGVVVPTCFVGSFALTASLPPFMSIGPGHAPPSTHAPTDAERAQEAVKELVADNGCWMGTAPPDMEGKLPGHAVVTWPGEKLPTYGGARAVRAGLEHYFEDKHERLQVHAFCR